MQLDFAPIHTANSSILIPRGRTTASQPVVNTADESFTLPDVVHLYLRTFPLVPRDPKDPELDYHLGLVPHLPFHYPEDDRLATYATRAGLATSQTYHSKTDIRVEK